MRSQLLGKCPGALVWALALILGGLLAAEVRGEQAPAGNLDFDVARFEVEGANPLSDDLTRRILAPHLGRHAGLAGLEEAVRALEKALKDKGYAFHKVFIPPQELSNGTVRLALAPFELADVAVDGAEHFSEANVRRCLPSLEAGKTLNTRQLARALQVANAHPVRQVAVLIRPGQAPRTLDATVKVRESRPWQAFATLANTGDAETGDLRLSVGATHTNLFDRDHQATVSFTTSPEYTGDVSQYGLHYRAPLYRYNAALTAFYSRSEIDQGLVGGFFEISGRGEFAGIGAEWTLTPRGRYSHKLMADLQDRLFDNDALFGSEDVAVDVRSRPLTVRYTGRLEKAGGTGGFSLEWAANTGSGGDNDAAAYAASRAGADKYWGALRYGGHLDLPGPRNWQLRARLTGQQADGPLIPGEQFGLGGSRSVRGYEERELSGDSGQQATAEIWSPVLMRDLRVLGFVDLGWRQMKDPQPVSPEADFLAGLGVGLRWQWAQRLNLVLDTALAARDADTTESGDWTIHFLISGRY